MTLIEIAIVLGIVAVLMGATVMGLGAVTGAKAKGAAGELSGVIRSLYDTAALTGHTCRLVFQLPKSKDDDSDARYWAECAKTGITASKDRDSALRDADQAARDKAEGRVPTTDSEENVEDLEAQEKAKVAARTRFSKYTTDEIRPRKLSGVRISVWTDHQTKAVSTGLAYLYFFPQGYTERAYVYVRQGEKNVWTIEVSPLTGKTKIVGRAVEVPNS